MADINVERKRSNLTAWLFALALVALLIVVLFALDRGVDVGIVQVPPADKGGAPTAANDPAAGDVSRTSATPPPPEVAALEMFAKTPPDDTGATHEYAATGVNRLAAALDAIAEEDAARDREIADRLAAFREKADQLQANPQSMRHADLVQQVFTSAVDLIASIQQRRLPHDNALRARVDTLNEQAQAMEPTAPLLDQTDRITDFFDTAAGVVATLARQT